MIGLCPICKGFLEFRGINKEHQKEFYCKICNRIYIEKNYYNNDTKLEPKRPIPYKELIKIGV